MQEALFYGFSVERHVPDNHLLRKIDRFVDRVAAHLKEALPNLEPSQLRPLAESIAAGDNVSFPALTAPVVHEAWANGFGRVMLYGGIGVWIMSCISLFIFNAGAARQAKVQPSE
jgi:hypothetical protein